jgi:hypothetical protein
VARTFAITLRYPFMNPSALPSARQHLSPPLLSSPLPQELCKLLRLGYTLTTARVSQPAARRTDTRARGGQAT